MRLPVQYTCIGLLLAKYVVDKLYPECREHDMQRVALTDTYLCIPCNKTLFDGTYLVGHTRDLIKSLPVFTPVKCD